MKRHMTPDHAPMQMETNLRLLILLARLKLTASQRLQALALCEDIKDWEEVTRQAEKLSVLPLAYHHLLALSPPTVTQDDLHDMRCQCLHAIQQNLRISGEQQRLVSDLLDPLDIPHLFFKGPSLAAQYYENPALRPCRDIDLLVSREDSIKLLQAALRNGYQAKSPHNLEPCRRSLGLVVRTLPVVSIISPMGVTVEVHTQLDKGARTYCTKSLITNRVSQSTYPRSYWVMPTSELFVYICFHHTRHLWSRLHWLADLDAVQRHPDFNLDEVYTCARRRGLKSTVDASLFLYLTLSRGSDEEESQHAHEQTKTILDACLSTVLGGKEAELAWRKTRPTPDFAFSWQLSKSKLLALRMRQCIQRLIPTHADYEAWPLPAHWQWLYYLTRPLRLMTKLIQSSMTTK
ncbi:nucleotidyltransferase domain-containing protein [Halomonas maura]|uniref:nucleotidyltransferase domain-containing protein n=1 Tax=Halomonas maura TaxID=117606 RepID=UPI0025B55E1F|nr:nucleotidyltransferase family protein [Halomonas maura]MDN3554785.1 nucleotidyltransferase family protein [Halomonas maura]